MIIHGHRGARGYLPENTLPSFIKAIEQKADAIELDIIINKDDELIISHEPWINEKVSLDFQGNKIIDGKNINLYTLSTSEIQAYNCGGIQHPQFPKQQRLKSHKPLFQALIGYLKTYHPQWLIKDKKTLLGNISLNIEIKSEEEWYDSYQPQPKKYAELVEAFISKNNLTSCSLIQCFDVQFLEEMYLLNPKLHYGLLVDEHENIFEKLELMSFSPSFCNPYYQLITKEVLEKIHQKNIQMLAWTVNGVESAKKLISMGIDGLITDYPDLLK